MTILERLKEMQDAGGRWMESPITHNALSRVADIYVCPDCGMDEALRDFGRIPLPVEDWAIPQMWKEDKR